MVRIWPSFDADADENVDKTSPTTGNIPATNAVGPMGRFTGLAATPAESGESATLEEIFRPPRWKLVASWTADVDPDAAEFSFLPPIELDIKPDTEYQTHITFSKDIGTAYLRLYEEITETYGGMPSHDR